MRTAALVVAASVLGSRILGLIRDALIAAFIGVSAESDLYVDAFLIPDFLNYLLAGAYLTITLVPILARHLESGDAAAASRAFTSVFRFISAGIIALTAVIWLFADRLVPLVFPEIGEVDRLVALTRLVLPAQIFLVIGALLMAVQYTHKRFLIPAMAPLIYNLGIIVGGLVGVAVGESGPEWFLGGALAGSAIGNFGLQWLGAKRTGTWFTPVSRGESSIREYLGLALPLMIGQSVAVLDEQFVRIFGQIEETAASALYFARRLNMVPVGLIAQAAGVAAFPFMASLAARGRDDELAETTARAARQTIFVAAAASVGLVVLARPLVRLIYRYGSFTSDDVGLVAELLMIFAASIPAWGLHQLLARHFYAKRRMWVPVVVGTAFTLLAVPAWLGLYGVWGIHGFAAASSIVMIAYALGLLVAWGFDSGFDRLRTLGPTFARAMVAAAFAVLVSLPLADALGGAGDITFARALLVVVVAGATALGAYLVASMVLGGQELREITRRSSPE